MNRIAARELLAAVLDAGSFVSWDEPPLDVGPGVEYRADLDRAAATAGTDESVLTGAATLRGRPIAVVACEFSFLAGSIGVAAAERVVTAVERATAERLPLFASPTSGGTRMQEGTIAFVQMVKIAAAVTEHKARGLPYLVYLRNPTMGGVFASWGSLGHVTFAQPGALIGFLGPRVFEGLYGKPFPAGVQVAENLYRNGVIDGVVPAKVLRHILYRALVVMLAESRADGCEPAAASLDDVPAWESVHISRNPRRPGIRQILRRATERVPLSGTGQGEADRTVLHALARLNGRPCVVFGHDRVGQTTQHSMGPAALREARRAMRLAEELRLPLVLVVDTPGASLSKEAEESGLAAEIAHSIADLVTVHTPTVSVLLGQGGGGGALALLPADRVVAAQHSWLAPLPPEGASIIVHRDVEHAAEIAAAQRIRAQDLFEDGIVDVIVPEFPDAAAEPDAFARRMVCAVAIELDRVAQRPAAELRTDRLRRYRGVR